MGAGAERQQAPVALGRYVEVLAAGLLADAVENMQQLGWLSFLARPLWHTGGVLSEDGTLGDIAHSFVGYADSPTALQLLVYVGYLAAVLFFFLRVGRRAKTASKTTAGHSVAGSAPAGSISTASAPASTAQAMDMVLTGLSYLAAADPTDLAAQAQAECLQAFEQADAIATAARAWFLGAFTTGQPLVGAIIFPVGLIIIVLLGLELVTGSFALVPLLEESMPRPLNQSHGRLSLGGYCVEVSESGLVPHVTIEAPDGFVFRGREPRVPVLR